MSVNAAAYLCKYKEDFTMIAWKNMDTLASYQALLNVPRVDLAQAMSGEEGAERVKRYTVPMGA